MKFYKYLFFIALFSFAVGAKAQTILPGITRSVSATAINNILKAERVFCYNVTTKDDDYKGYTLDDTAITGFCGVADGDLREKLIKRLLSTKENIDFSHQENCTIQPKVMLRFFRGVDSTDLLISSPCHSISIFYAGTVKTFNMKPAADLISSLVNSLDDRDTIFVSPAILDQLLPIGVPLDSEEPAPVNSNSQPKRGWETTQEKAPAKNNSGWNSIKF